MVSVEQRNKDFYTEKGQEALLTKVKTYIRIFNENKFPFTGQMLGFGEIEINDSQECFARILELSHLTGFQAKLKMDKGTGVAEIKY